MVIENKPTEPHSPSTGSACLICNLIEPCIHSLTLSTAKQKQTYPADQLKLVIFDDGGKDGQEVTITTVSKCSKNSKTCPKTYLQEVVSPSLEVSNDKKLLMTGSATHKQKFSFKETLKKSDFDKGIPGSLEDYLFSLLNSATSPMALFSEPRKYQVITKSCRAGLYGLIEIYPSVEFLISASFKYDFTSGRRSDNERREEQKKNKELAYEALKQTLPKDKNKLRRGWTKDTDELYLLNEKSIDIGITLKIQKTDYSVKLVDLWKNSNKTTAKSKDGLNRIKKMLDFSKQYLAPAPGEKGKVRSYKVAKFHVDPIKMGVSYGYTRTNKSKGLVGEHFIGLYADPLLKFTFEIDLLQLIAAYCKVDAIVDRARQYLASKKNGNGFNFECVLLFSAAGSIKVGGSVINGKLDYYCDKGNKIALGIKGRIALAFKTRVLFVEGMFEAAAEITAVGGMELEQHENGLDLVGYHGGIRTYVKLAASLMVEDFSEKYDYKIAEKQEFIICDPLKTKDSSFRINLLGEKKNIPEPAVDYGKETLRPDPRAYLMGDSNYNAPKTDPSTPYAYQQWEKMLKENNRRNIHEKNLFYFIHSYLNRRNFNVCRSNKNT